ncbi:MAG: hypothetical protein WKF84_05875 [Pyrinomonadaceae bacterium]
MIYISHTLGDVLELCDEIVVLRDGAVVGLGERSEFTLESNDFVDGRAHARSTLSDSRREIVN